jgi:DNA-binding transcriptional LysR family regulator
MVGAAFLSPVLTDEGRTLLADARRVLAQTEGLGAAVENASGRGGTAGIGFKRAFGPLRSFC